VKRFFSNMNPMLRGFLIIGLIALVVVVLELYQTLIALAILLRIAFLIAIAFFVYLVWRDNRHSIGMWPRRAQYVFYGAALTIVAAILVWFVQGLAGYDALAFILVLGGGIYAMWRTWRDQHTYS
jgi:small-conductance mechanosensitive channel